MHLSTWYQRENYSKTIQATSAGAVEEFNGVYGKFKVFLRPNVKTLGLKNFFKPSNSYQG